MPSWFSSSSKVSKPLQERIFLATQDDDAAGLKGLIESLPNYPRHDINDLQWTDDKGRTPLIYAAKKGYLKCANLLLQGRADVNFLNRKPESKGTALHEAVRVKHDKMVELLLEKGASPFCANSFGKTPFDDALDASYTFAVKRFKKMASYESAARMKAPKFGGMTQEFKPRHLMIFPYFSFLKKSELVQNMQLWIFSDAKSTVPKTRVWLDGSSVIDVQDGSATLHLQEAHPHPGPDVTAIFDRGFCLFLKEMDSSTASKDRFLELLDVLTQASGTQGAAEPLPPIAEVPSRPDSFSSSMSPSHSQPGGHHSRTASSAKDGTIIADSISACAPGEMPEGPPLGHQRSGNEMEQIRKRQLEIEHLQKKVELREREQKERQAAQERQARLEQEQELDREQRLAQQQLQQQKYEAELQQLELWKQKFKEEEEQLNLRRLKREQEKEQLRHAEQQKNQAEQDKMLAIMQANHKKELEWEEMQSARLQEERVEQERQRKMLREQWQKEEEEKLQLFKQQLEQQKRLQQLREQEAEQRTRQQQLRAEEQRLHQLKAEQLRIEQGGDIPPSDPALGPTLVMCNGSGSADAEAARAAHAQQVQAQRDAQVAEWVQKKEAELEAEQARLQTLQEKTLQTAGNQDPSRPDDELQTKLMKEIEELDASHDKIRQLKDEIANPPPPPEPPQQAEQPKLPMPPLPALQPSPSPRLMQHDRSASQHMPMPTDPTNTQQPQPAAAEGCVFSSETKHKHRVSFGGSSSVSAQQPASGHRAQPSLSTVSQSSSHSETGSQVNAPSRWTSSAASSRKANSIWARQSQMGSQDLRPFLDELNKSPSGDRLSLGAQSRSHHASSSSLAHSSSIALGSSSKLSPATQPGKRPEQLGESGDNAFASLSPADQSTSSARAQSAFHAAAQHAHTVATPHTREGTETAAAAPGGAAALPSAASGASAGEKDAAAHAHGASTAPGVLCVEPAASGASTENKEGSLGSPLGAVDWCSRRRSQVSVEGSGTGEAAQQQEVPAPCPKDASVPTLADVEAMARKSGGDGGGGGGESVPDERHALEQEHASGGRAGSENGVGGGGEGAAAVDAQSVDGGGEGDGQKEGQGSQETEAGAAADTADTAAAAAPAAAAANGDKKEGESESMEHGAAAGENSKQQQNPEKPEGAHEQERGSAGSPKVSTSQSVVHHSFEAGNSSRSSSRPASMNGRVSGVGSDSASHAHGSRVTNTTQAINATAATDASSGGAACEGVRDLQGAGEGGAAVSAVAGSPGSAHSVHSTHSARAARACDVVLASPQTTPRDDEHAHADGEAAPRADGAHADAHVGAHGGAHVDVPRRSTATTEGGRSSSGELREGTVSLGGGGGDGGAGTSTGEKGLSSLSVANGGGSGGEKGAGGSSASNSRMPTSNSATLLADSNADTPAGGLAHNSSAALRSPLSWDTASETASVESRSMGGLSDFEPMASSRASLAAKVSGTGSIRGGDEEGRGLRDRQLQRKKAEIQMQIWAIEEQRLALQEKRLRHQLEQQQMEIEEEEREKRMREEDERKKQEREVMGEALGLDY